MNLLIVDDQPFEVDGHIQNIDITTGISQIYKAYNGEEAKKILSSEQIDIILCDIEMPVCNGLALLEWIREHEIPLECIFLTSFPDFAYAKKAISLECLDYMLKPVSRHALNDVLKKAIQKILLKRTQSTEHHYSSLWFAHQPYIIDTLWADLLSGKISSTQAAVREQMVELNFPGMEVVKILPILIDVPESESTITASRKVIINNVMKVLAQEAIVDDPSYGAFIEFRTGSYFFICYEECGLEDCTERLLERCSKFIDDCEKILHFTPNCYIGKAIFSFQLKELAEYLLAISRNVLPKDTHVFPYDLWKECNSDVTLPDMNIIRSLIKKHLYEDVKLYYTEYFDALLKEHVIINHQLFVVKQDFLQVFYSYARDNEINMNTFWENSSIQKLYPLADSSVSCFLKLIAELCMMASEKVHQFSQPQSVIDQAVVYIHEHLKDDITREDVALSVCMNSDYFAKMFKKKTGLLISEYILKCRMTLAQELLKRDMSIMNIAMEIGFNSSSYFSTTFKRYTGKSPQEYKKENLKAKDHIGT